MTFRFILGIALATAAVGCSKKADKPAEPAAKTAPATTPAPTSAQPATPAAAPAAAAATDERCADPCRMLATVKLADLPAEVKKTCGTDWAPAADDCDQPDYLRNCIYATAGYTFKKREWRDTFGKASWYKARPDFKDSDLSPVATANIAALKQQASACHAGAKVSAEDQKLVEAWVAKLRAGKPEIPEVAFTHERVKPAELKEQLLQTKADFKAGRKTAYRYEKFDWGDAFAGKQVRTVAFSPGNAEPPTPDCDEECESGNAMAIAIDENNKIVGVSQMLSACPFVYAVNGDSKRYLGEVLRNLAQPGLEKTQPLAVQLPCADTYELEIAEHKLETTQLDMIALVVGDLVITPDQCAAGGAFCGNDGVAHTLETGDAIRVTFTLPAAVRCKPAQLVANGHYVPR